MRPRYAQDWVVDLSGRHTLEEAVAAAISAHPNLGLLEVRTDSTDLDFVISSGPVQVAELELKAKWRRYQGWGRYLPDVANDDLFILDEVCLRHLLDAGRHTHLLVRDHPMRRWVLFGLAELLFAPKARAVRQLQGNSQRSKGKVLIDLSDGIQCGDSLPHALNTLERRLLQVQRSWDRIEPWPSTRGVA